MATLVNHPTAANFKFRFRAFCRDDSFVGKWRQTEAEAKTDADDHLKKPQNADHTVEIEVEQKYSVVWTGVE